MLEITVGELVKKQRKKLNLTQAELAEKINSDSCYISRIETGTRKISIDNLVALANALNTSSDYLLGLSSNVVLHEHISEMESCPERTSFFAFSPSLSETSTQYDFLFPRPTRPLS